jgi:hypothetical protein
MPAISKREKGLHVELDPGDVACFSCEYPDCVQPEGASPNNIFCWCPWVEKHNKSMACTKKNLVALAPEGYTTIDAASYVVGVSISIVRRWCDSKKIPFIIVSVLGKHRVRYVRVEDIEQMARVERLLR